MAVGHLSQRQLVYQIRNTLDSEYTCDPAGDIATKFGALSGALSFGANTFAIFLVCSLSTSFQHATCETSFGTVLMTHEHYGKNMTIFLG